MVSREIWEKHALMSFLKCFPQIALEAKHHAKLMQSYLKSLGNHSFRNV